MKRGEEYKIAAEAVADTFIGYVEEKSREELIENFRECIEFYEEHIDSLISDYEHRLEELNTEDLKGFIFDLQMGTNGIGNALVFLEETLP